MAHLDFSLMVYPFSEKDTYIIILTEMNPEVYIHANYAGGNIQIPPTPLYQRGARGNFHGMCGERAAISRSKGGDSRDGVNPFGAPLTLSEKMQEA